MKAKSRLGFKSSIDEGFFTILDKKPSHVFSKGENRQPKQLIPLQGGFVWVMGKPVPRRKKEERISEGKEDKCEQNKGKKSGKQGEEKEQGINYHKTVREK